MEDKQFQVDRQLDIFPGAQFGRYHIKDDLLFDCIGPGIMWPGKTERVMGFNAGKGVGYALLAYFTARALNINRLPFCEDRIYSEAHRELLHRHSSILEQLTESRVRKICDEVKGIYKHTQNALKKAGYAKVRLKREIGQIGCEYSSSLARQWQAARVAKKSRISFDMDTLNSFGDEGFYNNESVVTLEFSVPARDILYCSKLIANRPGEREVIESGEWVIINRSPTGLVDIPLTSVKVNKHLLKSLIPMDEVDAERYIQNHTPFVFRSRGHIEPHYNRAGLNPTLRFKVMHWLFRQLYK